MHSRPQTSPLGIFSALMCLTAVAVRPIAAQLPTLPPVASIVADDSLAVEPTTQVGTIAIPPALQALSGGRFRISLSKAASAAVTVAFTVSGSATAGVDYTGLPSTVTIAAGATSATIDVAINDDSQVERDETIVVTLQAGGGYTVLGTASATVVLIDNDQQVRFTLLEGQLSEPAQKATVRVERLGTLRGALRFALMLAGAATNGTDVTTLPDSLVIPDGQGSMTFDVVPRPDALLEPSETLVLRAGGVSFLPAAGLSLQIIDAVLSISTSVARLNETAGSSATVTVTRTGILSQAASVSLAITGTATNGVDYNTVPQALTIAAGAASASLTIVMRADSLVEGAETIAVSITGGTSLAIGPQNVATIVIDEAALITISNVSFAPGNNVLGGTTVTGSLQLSGAAPVDGITASIALSGTATGTKAPATVVVPSGQQLVTFAIATSAVAVDAQATVTASIPGGASLSRNFTVRAPGISAYALSRDRVTPQSLHDSASAAATVTLEGPAPAGGLPLELVSASPAFEGHGNFVVPAGQSRVTVPLHLAPVATSTSASITLRRNGNPLESRTLIVDPPSPLAVTFSPSVIVGQIDGRVLTTGTFTLNGATPAAGLTPGVTAGTPITIVQTAALSAGATSGTFGITASPVGTSTAAPVTVAVAGASSTGIVTVNAPTAVSGTLSASTVVGGSTVSATIRLAAPAAANFTVAVGSNNAAAFPCDATGKAIDAQAFASGALTSVMSICSRVATARVNTTLTIGSAPSALTLSLGVLPRVTMVLADADFPGGDEENHTGTVLLAAPAPPEGSTFQLGTSDPAVGFKQSTAVASPTQSTMSITVPGGQTSGGFILGTSVVSTDRPVTLSASAGTATATATFTLRAPTVRIVNISSTMVAGAQNTASLQVNVNAPSTGTPVQLSSSSANASVPAVVTVPSGGKSVTFAIVTPVTATGPFTITATTGAITRSSSSTIVAPNTPAISAISFPGRLAAGESGTLRIRLNAIVPAGGIVVTILNTNPRLNTPATLAIPAGRDTASFEANAALFGQPGPAVQGTLSVTTGGAVPSLSSFVGVVPIQFNVSLAGTVAAGTSASGTITLSMQSATPFAPAGGITVNVSSNSASITVPSTITIAAGQTSAPFTISTAAGASGVTGVLTFTFDQFNVFRNISIAPP